MAMVDITTLAATGHALAGGAVEGELHDRRQLSERLRADVRRASVAYINTLARSKQLEPNELLLVLCRVAAEREMPRALRLQDALKRLMTTGAGTLTGVAAARQDLWRLATLVIHLRKGIAALRDADGDLDEAKKASRILRRRLRRALIAYARAGQRDGPDGALLAARKAALDEIGKRGVKEADRLGRLEAREGDDDSVIRRGVTRPLNDLVLDWTVTG